MPRETSVAIKPKICLRYPDCSNEAKVRGVCIPCYNAFLQETDGDTLAEEECIRAGRILSPYGGKTARQWFREAISKRS